MKLISQDSSGLSKVARCKTLEVVQSRTSYRCKLLKSAVLANQITDSYKANPMYGYRRIWATLREQGIVTNKKQVQWIMRKLGLKAIYPEKKTTIRKRNEQVYPYLLKDLDIKRIHQVWQVDITHIRTSKGFIYLVAIIDVFSRMILAWRTSNTMETRFCIDTLYDAFHEYGCPVKCQIETDPGALPLPHSGIIPPECFGA